MSSEQSEGLGALRFPVLVKEEQEESSRFDLTVVVKAEQEQRSTCSFRASFLMQTALTYHRFPIRSTAIKAECRVRRLYNS